ncbi:hypothetical protein Naga_101947g1 [Nannochloropsis gaditana]|uniref:Uncharacterized protein n=1 Tax=Nannochloropsis gaditana TaxID=72520 RepID=W7THU2_9STRA|nr:hypothetical protein Naga_101947g1 [Nannochloropsis gaditana]
MKKVGRTEKRGREDGVDVVVRGEEGLGYERGKREGGMQRGRAGGRAGGREGAASWVRAEGEGREDGRWTREMSETKALPQAIL